VRASEPSHRRKICECSSAEKIQIPPDLVVKC
jgi:hypothetical protein